MTGFLKGSMDHTCHMTDPKADLYSGRKRPRPCIGFLGMMKRHNGGCISPRAIRAMEKGELDWAKIPTRGVFASPRDCVRFHGEANGMRFDKNGNPIREAKDAVDG